MSVFLLVYLSVCMSPNFCVHCISRTNARKLTKLYIQMYLVIIYGWFDFNVYCSTGRAVTEHFPPNFGILISLVLMHGIVPNLGGKIHILRKCVNLTLVLIGRKVVQVCHIFLEFRDIYNLLYLLFYGIDLHQTW